MIKYILTPYKYEVSFLVFNKSFFNFWQPNLMSFLNNRINYVLLTKHSFIGQEMEFYSIL